MAKVMIVDDEDVLLEMIVLLIEELGYQAVLATNGQEALAFLSHQSELPALIISDVMMPRMNGVELARAIKTTPGWNTIPIILMSAAGRPRANHVADSFLAKPFELDTLAALIENYVDHQKDSR